LRIADFGLRRDDGELRIADRKIADCGFTIAEQSEINNRAEGELGEANPKSEIIKNRTK